MSNFVILTDSSADLSEELVRELLLLVLPLSFQLQGKTYHNYPDNREISPGEFYRLLRAGESCTTSAVNVAAYQDILELLLQAGKDVLILSFSSGLSATYQSSKVAGEELSEKYPQRKLLLSDTLSASLGQGLLVWHAAQKRNAGASIEEVHAWVEEQKLHLCHWFTVDDLNYLKRGGRVSATSALLGTMLSIKPVMHTSDEGKLVPVGKVRGRKASLNALIDKIGELGIAPEKQTMFICQADCEDEARWVADQIKARYGTPEVHINFIGPVIGSHTGPNTIGIFFVGKER